MRLSLILLVIVSFVGIAVFGVFSMGGHGDHGHNGCIATAVQGVQNCPEENNTLSFLNFHLNTFKSFSSATFNNNHLISFLFFAALALLLGFKAINNQNLELLPIHFSYFYYIETLNNRKQ